MAINPYAELRPHSQPDPYSELRLPTPVPAQPGMSGSTGGGGGKKGAPERPDPYVLGEKQYDINRRTIEDALRLGAIGISGPGYSLDWERDANGLPTRQRITLGANEQAAYNATNALRNTILGNAQTMAGRLPTDLTAGLGATPSLDGYSGDKVEQALYDRRMNLMRPDFARQANDMNVMLTERGIPVTSEIDRNFRDQQAQRENEAAQAAASEAIMAGGQEQSRQLAEARQTRANTINERSLPYQQLQQMMSMVPSMQMPGPVSTPWMQSAPPDLMGGVMSQYNTDMNAYNRRQESMLNGLFGLLSLPFGLMKSDKRAKTDIRRVGQTDGGLPVYIFRYHGDPEVRMGVMAQEVLETIPEAVLMGDDGLLRVDYRKVA